MLNYIAVLVNRTNGKKTPKYVIDWECGTYPPMDALRGKDGKVSMYLQPKRESQTNVNTPLMQLQAKSSFNFTGLKEYKVDEAGKGFAYGYPYDSRCFSKDNKPNPFYAYKDDLFLFVMDGAKMSGVEAIDQLPSKIWLIVVKGCKSQAPQCYNALLMGGFDDTMSKIRALAAKGGVL